MPPCHHQFIATFTTSFKTKNPPEVFASLSQEKKRMAPSGRTITAEATATTSTKTASRTKTITRRTRRIRHPRRTHFKKQQQQQNKVNKKQEIMATVLPSSSQDSSKEGDMDTSEVIDVSNNSACSTPKGQKFRIPEISTCPPAPKKPRVLSNCSLRRSPLSFFAPPDLELFFFMALRDVSV